MKAGELVTVDLEAVMKVNEIMTTAPEAGRPEDNLARAVELLWQADCGVLPIVDDTGRVAGILTDRDICIALGTRNARASDVPIASVMRPTVYICEPGDDVLAALALMSDRRVRRLPVVEGGRLVGVVSLNDAVLRWAPGVAACVRARSWIRSSRCVRLGCPSWSSTSRPWPGRDLVRAVG